MTAAGGWFAAAQSAGAAGLATGTQVGIFGTVTGAVSSFFEGCEAE